MYPTMCRAQALMLLKVWPSYSKPSAVTFTLISLPLNCRFITLPIAGRRGSRSVCLVARFGVSLHRRRLLRVGSVFGRATSRPCWSWSALPAFVDLLLVFMICFS